MGIVSEPWGEGKGLVATNYRDTSGDRGWTEGQGRQSGPAEGRPRHAGPAARDGRTHEVSRAGAGICNGGCKNNVWRESPLATEMLLSASDSRSGAGRNCSSWSEQRERESGLDCSGTSARCFRTYVVYPA